MTPVGVFFCWQGGAERDFVNSTILIQRTLVVVEPVLLYLITIMVE